MKKIIIYTDGGSRGNPGPAGIGAVLLSEGGEVLKEISEYIGERTNNFAEYEALLFALRAAQKIAEKEHTLVGLMIRMDSELVVKQLKGEYKVKDATLREKHTEAKKLFECFAEVHVSHVYREQNKHADRLVNQALDAQR